MSQNGKSAFFCHVFAYNFFGTFLEKIVKGCEIRVKFGVFRYPC
jgi:hypothetical protein